MSHIRGAGGGSARTPSGGRAVPRRARAWLHLHRVMLLVALAATLAVLGGVLTVLSRPAGGAPQPPLADETSGVPTASSSWSSSPVASPELTGRPTTSTVIDGGHPQPSAEASSALVASAPTDRVSASHFDTEANHGTIGAIGATDLRQPRDPVMPRSIPASIEIPSIGVQSQLLQLGLNDDGTVEVPPLNAQPSQAGWYQYSPTPGEIGPSVILGHVDSAASGPAVFFRLGALKPGDRILIHRADGTTAVFRVDRDVRYPKAHFPTTKVYGDIDHAGLRLITCGGSFDFSTRHYQDNIVVYASLVAAKP